MTLEVSIIEKLIREKIPDATVIAHELSFQSNNYTAKVISESFRGKSRLQQHKMVYAAIGSYIGEVVHAFTLKTAIPLNQGI
ncbi:MAG: BolA-like protein [Candidatus Tokpelaia sp. JSC161]|jgi:stress-induced morphogen|nr:MAG: BolA-like protein [Candidatus Tokpelaia sp. JSC161]